MRNRRLPAERLVSLAVAALSSLACAQLHAQSVQPGSAVALGGTLSATQASPQRQAAQVGLRNLAAHLSMPSSAGAHNRIFNLDDYRALREATIGSGFEMYLVDPRALLSGKRLGESLYGSGEWRFVVMANGKGAGLITVARMNGKWTMVEAGASELADELASVSARYTQRVPQAQLRFVRCQQAVADFIEVSTPDAAAAATAPVYVPLASARAMLGRGHADLAAADSVLSDAQLSETLRQSVQLGLGDPRFGH